MKKQNIFIIFTAIFMFLVTIMSAYATIIRTDYNITSVDIKDYNNIILTTSQDSSALNTSVLLQYKISTNSIISYSYLYNGSIMYKISGTAINSYYQHTYAIRGNGYEYFVSPYGYRLYYKQSTNPNNWVEQNFPPSQFQLVTRHGGIFSNSNDIFHYLEGLSQATYFGGLILNYEPSYLWYFQVASSFYPFVLQNYGDTSKPLFNFPAYDKLALYVDELTYLNITGINTSGYVKGLNNGNYSKIFLLDNEHNVHIFLKNGTLNYYEQPLHYSCSDILSFVTVNDFDCKNDNECLLVGYYNNTANNSAAIISYNANNEIVCSHSETAGKKLTSVTYNPNSYYEDYFYGGEGVFGTTANIEFITAPANISIPRPDGFAYNLYSPDLCMYDSSTRQSYLCINSQYDNNTQTFYCPSADSVINCTYGCVNIMNDKTTNGIKFYYLDRLCSDTPISFSCIAYDIIAFLIPNPSLMHLCNPLTQTAGLDASYCDNTNIRDTIINNPSRTYYTGGTCIAEAYNYTCTLGQSRCLGYYNVQTCQVNSNGYNFWNNTESCTIGKVCSNGDCIINPNPNNCVGIDCPINPTDTDVSVLNFINNLFGTSGSSSGAKALIAFLMTIIAVILTVVIFASVGLIEMAGLFSIFETIIFTVLFALMGFYPLWLTIVFAILAAVAVVLFVKAIFING